MKVVIVGGVAGGASAAARIRRLDEQAEIVVFERSGYVSYANCGLPYFIGDVITEPGALTLQTPESFFSRFRVQMKVRHEVTAIHPERKCVSVKDLVSGAEFEESYDKLLLSPGARPVRPALPGMDSDRLFTLRTVEDTFRIKSFIREHGPRSAVLIGGGFIGVELAENLRELGMEVTIAELSKQLMSPFDADMASLLHNELRRNGVQLALGRRVAGFAETDGGIEVQLENSAPLRADMAILAIGVSPESALAKEAGLTLGLRGSILVNDRMETSAPDIYAVGDAVQVKHFVTGDDALLSLAGPANKQGRIAADNICGGDSRYRGSLGSSVLKVFDLTAASTGISEAAARRAGIDADAVVLSPMSHAGYYPGGKVMTMKVVFEKETFRLLGAQIIGYEGVDKRIDVLATALYAGMNAVQLKELDLSYAPPYSSAKDPVNMAGFMIDNIKNGALRQWRLEDEPEFARDGSVTLLDVRTAAEYERGHIDGFRNIPVDELRDRLHEIEPGKPVYVICQSGVRSYIACRILEGSGFTAYNFSGGYRFFEAAAHDRALIETAHPCGMDMR
ncbi:MAG: FAD-dependent oxidoreductase [Eubacteriales bacterium]|nr:FAD-dependent oxidoreductase [Eubacteriales bacterium]